MINNSIVSGIWENRVQETAGVQDILVEHRFHLAGHIFCFADYQHSKIAVWWTSAGEKCKKMSPNEDIENFPVRFSALKPMSLV